MSDSIYEYSNFKVDLANVDDGWYLVKDGITYRVEVPINKMRLTKSINIFTGEVRYPSNADRIRSMTDEELAEWVNHHTAVCVPGKRPGRDCPVGACGKCWLAWLKQEVSE